MAFIDIKRLSHKFNIKDADGNVIGEHFAINNADITVHKGSIIAIMGKNGSGKSTLARHMNGLLSADDGSVIIAGKNASDKNNLLDIRKSVGMVFQNPDNQIIGNSVSEDVGFGLENIGMETENIWKRIDDVLRLTGMSAYIDRNTSRLSGGQKQRLAIASVMAMKPECIVFDEATSMLDPAGSSDIMELVYKLNKEQGITIILITHKMKEAMKADYIYIMSEGRVRIQGRPDEILAEKADMLTGYGIELPLPYRLGNVLGYFDKPQYKDICNNDKVMDLLVENIKQNINTQNKATNIQYIEKDYNGNLNKTIIHMENVSYTYKKGDVSVQAVKSVSLSIKKGEIVAVVGHTGSGKSTLLQMINGLIRPTEGVLLVDGIDVVNTRNLKELRKRIGFVFQYPEYQLFEDTVIKDVMYGPKNFGMDNNQAKEAAIEALRLTGLDERYYESSPFEMSGGQKKRVAL
ncbi:MAG: energy-coupling factor transporter ATPase, partial [Coprococcus sp.]